MRVSHVFVPLPEIFLMEATVNRTRPVKHDQPTLTVTRRTNHLACLPVGCLDFHAQGYGSHRLNCNATCKRLLRSNVSSPFVEVTSVSSRALLIPSRTTIIYHTNGPLSSGFFTFFCASAAHTGSGGSSTVYFSHSFRKAGRLA